MGVNIHFTSALPGELDMLNNKGFNMIRMDFYWENIEKLEGLLAELMRRDIKPYWVLDYGNQIYDDGEFPHSAEAISAFVDFDGSGPFSGKGGDLGGNK
jgi:hypothetical protein